LGLNQWRTNERPCTPASGWEKGQVENQVGLVRERFFTPRLRVKSLDELNAWLMDKCVAYAKAHRHPEESDQTIWEMFEAERPHLVPYVGRFDGFHSVPASVSKTCTVRFDNTKYSVLATAVGRPVEVHAYAERIVIRQDGVVVGEHARAFGRGQTVYDPWHYVPVLARKPGALRNGAPFKDWVLPPAMAAIRRKLKGSDDGDRQMVNALIYMHRYRPDTVSVVLNDYLREFISKLQAERGRLEKLVDDPSAMQSQRVKARKDVAVVIKQIAELEEWEREVVFPLAQAKIEIDLDDGVKRNYPKFGAALKPIKGLEAADE